MGRQNPRRKDPAPAAKGIHLPASLAMLVLYCAALALYWGSLRNPLVFDDYHLREQALKTQYASVASWLDMRWISGASFGWIYRAFGPDLLWQRLANVLLHAGAALAIFGFVARLVEAVLQDHRARWLALGGALLFVLHPVAIYGTAYLMQRSIVLATLFSVLALWCVLEALLSRGGGWRAPAWYAAATLAYALAVFSKEHAVMVPAVAIALAILIRGASWQLARSFAIALVPLAAVGLFVVFRSRGLLVTAYEPFAADVFGRMAGGRFDAQLAYPLSVLNQAALFFRYVATWLLPWPGWISVDLRPAFPEGLADLRYLSAFAAWLAWPLAGAWLLAKRGRAGLAGFAMLFAWLLALTEFSAVRIQEVFVLYRSYLWLGVPLALAPALAAPLPARAQFALVAIACVAFVAVARERLDSFSSPLKLWDDAVRKNTDMRAPHVERAMVARGIVYLDAARHEEAGRDFERALQLNPRLPDAYLGRATLFLRTGRLAEAHADLDKALSLDPSYPDAYHKRCVVRMSLRRAADAIADCEQAQRRDAANHEVWVNSGVVYRALGRAPEAEASYRRALELEPGDPSAHFNYGVLLLDSGRRDEGVRQHIEKGCKGGIPGACGLLAPRRRNP